MDLSFLIPSKTRRTLLEYFVNNPDTQTGVRELAREIKLSPQVTHRELVNLENWGFLFSSSRGSQRAFRINKKFIFNSSLSDLFRLWNEEKNQTYEIANVYDWKKLEANYKKIEVPEELIPGLTKKRIKPRAWNEEKAMKRKGLL